MRSRTHARGFDVRKLTPDEALAHGHRLRQIFREAVLRAGVQRYTQAQVEAWAQTADDLDRWDAWMHEGATWAAAPHDASHHLVGVAMMWPSNHVHLLYVDPAFHRRGIARTLLEAVEHDARRAKIRRLGAHASLLAHPVFLKQGYKLVDYEESQHRGQYFVRALMQKALR